MSAAPRNPYVGLRPFDVDDSHLFFGRRSQTTELLNSLYRQRFLGVVGSSGCGKSSLIKAGLIPALRGGFLIEDRDEWRIAQLTPGDSPLQSLAAALARAFTDPSSRKAHDLRGAIQAEGICALPTLLSRFMAAEVNLLLLVDQFEEIFAVRGEFVEGGEETLDADTRRRQFQRRADAEDFVSLVLTLSQRVAHVYVVATMRSDFLGDCDVFYGLPEAMNKGRYLVPRLTRKQLEEAIVGPATFSGAEIAKALLDRLLNELGDRFDRLPILQHALMRTWKAWYGDPSRSLIEVRHYDAAGTLNGALAIHAGELLDGLANDPLVSAFSADDSRGTSDRERAIAGVFQSLTDTDSAGRQVKRAARLGQIADENGLTRETVTSILRPFRDAGFVYATALEDTNATGQDERYSLSHESLIRQWESLKRWVAEERESRDTYRELVSLAEGEKKGEKGLLRNPDLQFKRRWWERKAPRPSWARRYVNKADDFSEAERYLSRSTRAQVRRWAIAVVAVVGVLITLGTITAWALVQRGAARTSADRQRASAEDAQSLRIQAERNLKLAREKEEEARRNEVAARNSAAEAADSLVAANDARTRADLKALETTVANISSRLDPQDVPGLRDSLWNLTIESETVQEQVLRRMLASDPTADRFLRVSPSIVGALLGTMPAARIGPIRRVALDVCVTHFRDILRRNKTMAACRLLVRELGAAGAADSGFGDKAMAAVQASAAVGMEDLVAAFQTFGDALSDDDVSRVGHLVLTIGVFVRGDRMDGALDFLARFGNRLREEQRRTLVDAIVAELQTRDSRGWPYYELTDDRMDALRRTIVRSQARTVIDRINGLPNETDPRAAVERARILGFLGAHLTDREALAVEQAIRADTSLSGQSYTDRERFERLRRLGENLPKEASSLFAADLLTWIRESVLQPPGSNPNLLESIWIHSTALNALYTVRGSFDSRDVQQLAGALSSNIPVGHITERLQLLVAIGSGNDLSALGKDQRESLLLGSTIYIAALSNPDVSPQRNLIDPAGPVERAVLSAVRPVVLNSDTLFASGSEKLRDVALNGGLLDGLSHAEWTVFLGSVPRNASSTTALVRFLPLVGEDRATELVRRIVEQHPTLGDDLDALGRLTLALGQYLDKHPYEAVDLSPLTTRWLDVLEKSTAVNRSEVVSPLLALRRLMTDAQASQVIGVLSTVRGAGFDRNDAIFASHFTSALNASQAERVVDILSRSFATEDFSYSREVLALGLARLGRYLKPDQRQQILPILLTDSVVSRRDVAAALPALIPFLDNSQVASVRSALEKHIRDGNWDLLEVPLASLADRLAADRRHDTMQLLLDSVDRQIRASPYNTVDKIPVLVRMWDKFDQRQKEQALQLIVTAWRSEVSIPVRELPIGDLVALARKAPTTKSSLTTGMIQRLETGSPLLRPPETLSWVGRVNQRPLSSQDLLNILKWPTLDLRASRDIVGHLAGGGGTVPESVLRPQASLSPLVRSLLDDRTTLELNRWALANWATSRHLDLSQPQQRPAGYQ